MVVRVSGRIDRGRPSPAWQIWFGPAALLTLLAVATLSALALPLELSPHQVAGGATAGLIGLAFPLLRLARDLKVCRFGIEADLYRGSSRYVRFDEIDSMTLHRRAIGPSRMCIEDVYGHKIHLRGNLADLQLVLVSVERRIAGNGPA